jgi:membrane-associated phospholipid phosphatase
MTATGGFGKDAASQFVVVARRMASNLVAWVRLLCRARAGGGVNRRLLPARGPIAVATVAAVVAIAAAMVLLDAAAIGAAARLPLGVVDAFNEITDFGLSGWFLLPIALVIILLAALASPDLGRMTYLVLVAVVLRLQFVFIAVAAPGLLFTILKRLIGRVRPSELGPFAYSPFSWRAEFASLPSGHSTTAFSAAIAIGALFPRARPAMWIYAGIIAISRVVISVHFPSDVIAGAVVGGFGAILVRNAFAMRRLVFAVGRDGKVHVMPGPSLQRVKRVAGRIFAH